MLKVLQEKRANWAQQTKPQATTLISLWFCGYKFMCPDLCCDEL